MSDARMKTTVFLERRKFPRSFLDLPLEYRMIGIPYTRGGIAVNGSEAGLLLYSLRDMPVGTKLDVAVLFPNCQVPIHR